MSADGDRASPQQPSQLHPEASSAAQEAVRKSRHVSARHGSEHWMGGLGGGGGDGGGGAGTQQSPQSQPSSAVTVAHSIDW